MTNHLMRYLVALLGIMALWLTPAAVASEAATSETTTGETATSEAATVLPAIETYENYNQRNGRYFMGWQFSVDVAMTISQLGGRVRLCFADEAGHGCSGQDLRRRS